jgi:hypothetical protein
MALANITNNILTDSGILVGSLLTTSSAASTYVPYTGATADLVLGNRLSKANSFYADGDGSFTSGGLFLKQYASGATNITGYNIITTQTSGFLFSASVASSFKNFILDASSLTDVTQRTYTLPDASGTLALTSSLSGMVTGTGTTNYLPKFTGASSIGNSILSESGYTLTQTSSNALSVYVIKGTGSTTGLWLYTNGVNATLSNQDNGSLAFQTNGTDRLTIASTGAATFSSSVTATGNATTNASVIFNNPSGASGTAQWYGDYTAGASVIARIFRGNGASGVVANGLNIDNFGGFQVRVNQLGGSGDSINLLGGNVGIGTTSPSQLLHLQTTFETSSGVGTAIQIESGGAGGDQGWIGVNKGTGNGLEISVENRDIIFNTGATSPFGGSERMRITSGGNVLVNTTTTSDAKLDVYNDSSNYAAYFRANTLYSGAYRLMRWYMNGNSVMDITGDSSSISFNNNQSGFISFGTAGAERIRITSEGSILIGTTTEGFLGKLQVAGSVAITGQYNTVLPSSSFSYFDGSGQVVSSSSNASALYLDTTWNTTGNPDGIYLNVTNTASGASSKLLNLKVGSVSQFSVSKGGAIQTSDPTNGTARPWKLGDARSGGISTDSYIIVEVNGVTYSIPALNGLP